MHRTTTVIALMLLTAVATSVSSAAFAGLPDLPRDKFEKRLAKSAVTDVAKPAALCVCKDGSQNQDRAGILVQVPQGVANGIVLVLNCNVLVFDSTTGALVGLNGCPEWELLPK